jgi:hypothetical protein
LLCSRRKRWGHPGSFPSWATLRIKGLSKPAWSSDISERKKYYHSRVSFFMNKFRKLGFVAYNRGALSVHSSLLNVLLHD